MVVTIIIRLTITEKEGILLFTVVICLNQLIKNTILINAKIKLKISSKKKVNYYLSISFLYQRKMMKVWQDLHYFKEFTLIRTKTTK